MREINQPQVNKNHYSFENYSSERRFISYYHQVNNVMKFVENNHASNILIAGKGDGIVQRILETYSNLFKLNLSVKTFDIAEDLDPDILGDLIELRNYVREQYDVILCCQTLEHVMLDEAFQILEQMRFTSRFVIISVPYKAFTIRGCLKVPFIDEFEFLIKIPLWKNKKGMVDSRHYWEIGYSISKRKFKKEIRKIGYGIISDYVIKKDGFKQFFVLESGNQ